MHHKILQLKDGDNLLTETICNTLKTAYDSNVSRFFIYQDKHYQNYFRSLIKHPSYYTFYCYNTITTELAGFACFELIKDIVLLKNIIIDNTIRRSGLGTQLLSEALNLITKDTTWRVNTLQLDVFEKNSMALSWYLDLGMKVIDTTFWYDLGLHFEQLDAITMPESIESSDLVIKEDRFHFCQLLYNDLQIGTWIDRKTLSLRIIPESTLLLKIYEFVREHQIVSVGLISKDRHKYSLIDRSFRCSIPLKQLSLLHSGS